MKSIHVFVSYSHEDSLWVQEGPHGLIPWLDRQLRRDGVQIWFDHALKQMPGAEYKKLIQSEIERADFAILLISQDFVGSDFIREYELPWIRERVEHNELGLITILAGPVCDEDLDWLADRQMLPGKPMPLIDYTDNAAGWKRVRNEILQAVRSRIRALRESSAASQPDPRGGQQSPPPAAVPAAACPPVAANSPSANDTLSLENATCSRSSSSQARPADPSATASPQSQPRSAPDDGVASRQPAPVAPVAKIVIPTKEEIVPPPSSPLEVITNSIGMPMVLIPAGEFLMGSPDSDRDALPSEKPQHRVRVTRPFCLGVYPVTQAEYERVMGSNPSHFKNAGPTAPVECVSWDDAQEFCRKLSVLPTEQTAGHVYRLPTEAEWEYACRAGSTSRYCFDESREYLGDYAWYNVNSVVTTHPVGQKKPNAWGLCDMHGNVWEWCADWFDEGYYVNSPADDSAGPPAGSHRVFRGGSWGNVARDCRSADRLGYTPGGRTDFLGFRVASSSVGASGR